jgi:hypothetical protein
MTYIYIAVIINFDQSFAMHCVIGPAEFNWGRTTCKKEIFALII